MPIRGIGPLNAKIGRMQRALSVIVPKRLANDAERWFKRSFVNQGFTDSGFRRWAPVKGKKRGTILKRSGHLANSVRAEVRGLVIHVSAGGSQIPYARIHNEGGTIQRQVTRRAHFRKPKRAKEHHVRRHQVRMNLHIRKRQYMGRSRQLEVKMRTTVYEVINEAMR